jgi:S1-C subfamily serine protease
MEPAAVAARRRFRRGRWALLILGLAGALAASLAARAALGSPPRSHLELGVVDISTRLGYQGGAAAGTGMIITPSGEVLTNNHVVEGATSIRARDVRTGHTYAATVTGTDVADDVALLKLKGASNLDTVTLGNSSTAAIGAAVTAVGNAGGVGGDPAISHGTITRLRQTLTISDTPNGISSRLVGLIQTNASLEPGDSGGPLYDSSGRVIGMDTAASLALRFRAGPAQGFAIPVNRAMAVVKQIEAGRASARVHIGPAAFLGIQLAPGDEGPGTPVSGVVVGGVLPQTPAETAGLNPGDVITSVDGQRLGSPASLSALLRRHHPGDTVQLQWVDGSGQAHSAAVTLIKGPVT